MSAPIEILTSALRGERLAREAFVRAHQDDVYRAVARILGPSRRDRWEDVAQDAMVKVLSGLAGFDPEGAATVRTWVLTIAARTAIDVLRRGRREDARAAGLQAVEADAASAAGDGPEATLAGRELAERVARAMELLPDDQRVALVLRAYHDLDYAEIAVATQASVSGVKARLHRARTALARLIGRGDGHGDAKERS